MRSLSGREQHARRPTLHGDSPDYADDVDAPDPYDGHLPPYRPAGWSLDRIALAAEEAARDEADGTYDEVA